MIVIECGIDPDYFLDKMQWYEVEACLDGLENKGKTSWEQTRFLAYITAQVNSSKKLKPTDILSFKWDEIKAGSDTSISNEDVQRLKDKAKQLTKILK